MVMDITITRLLITLEKARQRLLATKISTSVPIMNLSKLKNRMLKLMHQVIFYINFSVSLESLLIQFINMARFLISEGERSSSRLQVRLTARFRDAGEIGRESTEANNSGSAKKKKKKTCLIFLYPWYSLSYIDVVGNLLDYVKIRQIQTDVKLMHSLAYVCAWSCILMLLL